MTEEIVSTFRQRVDRVILHPSSGGRYEVRINGDLVHSKAQTGRYPTNEAIVAEIRKRLDAGEGR
ncbi:MAG: Rdx family protein [Chloroflexota bacterium]|nr:Rdx family protein [Chloroflexota bacterium]